jgi:ubiquinone/menaquinone biosynthesis C-methylase UbiE
MGMRSALFRFYWKLEALITPDLRYSQIHYLNTLREIVSEQCRWLDLGCGHQMFASWMIAEEKELCGRANRLVGIDLDFEGMKKHQSIRDRVFGNLEQLPFPAASFDVVTANMVIEHLGDPASVLEEIHRVLAPGGCFVFHTPNVRNPILRTASVIPSALKRGVVRILDGRKEEDVFETFYRLNSDHTIPAVAGEHGFAVQKLNLVSSSAITAVLGPLSIFELLMIRLLDLPKLQCFRSNIVAVLRNSSLSR